MAGVVNFPLLRTPCLRPGLVEVVLRMAQAFVEAELVGVHNEGREIGRGNGESGPRSARLLDPFPRCPSLGGLSSFILPPEGTPSKEMLGREHLLHAPAPFFGQTEHPRSLDENLPLPPLAGIPSEGISSGRGTSC